MRGGVSANAEVGNYSRPTANSFEFTCMADGGKPIEYDKTLLAGDDDEDSDRVFFAAAEIETWQL